MHAVHFTVGDAEFESHYCNSYPTKNLRIAKLDDQRASVAVLRRMARTASMTKQNNKGKDMGDSNTVANSFSAGVRPTLDLVG